MNTSTFYGRHLGRVGRETSSSDENEDDTDACYLPSQEEIESLGSDDDESDENEASGTTANSIENQCFHDALPETTAWRSMKSSSRAFDCTATEERHFSHELPTDRPIEPIDIYNLFVCDEVVELIVTETNNFFEETMGATPSTRHSKVKQWKPISAEDVKKLLGILITMGLNKQPTFDCYWSKGQIYGCELIQKTMSRNKFELIMRFLHFADNRLSDGSDRLYKLKPLIDLISRNFLKFTPGKDVVLKKLNNRILEQF